LWIPQRISWSLAIRILLAIGPWALVRGRLGGSIAFLIAELRNFLLGWFSAVDGTKEFCRCFPPFEKNPEVPLDPPH
jgi:hypothetical protein